MGDIIQCFWQWLQSQWVQSDLASWIAVILAGGAALLALKALYRISYVEFHPGWTIKIQNNKVIVQGNITVDSSSVLWEWKGTVMIGGDRISLVHKKQNSHPFIPNTDVITFEGEYKKHLQRQVDAALKIKVTLGDGKSKSFKTRIHLPPTSNMESSQN